jgi:hypothetical protein
LANGKKKNTKEKRGKKERKTDRQTEAATTVKYVCSLYASSNLCDIDI